MKLTAREAARMLGVSETKIYRWVDAGEIPFTMVHHRPLFHRLELLEWAMEQELPLAVDLYEHGETLPFTSALSRGGDGTLGAELGEIADHIHAISPSDRELIRAVIAARGAEMFVGRSAESIAMPRASSPLICSGSEGVVLLRWASHRALMVGNVPINVVFLIVAPTIRRHHELLSRLSLALHDRMFRAATQRVGAFAEVVAEAHRWEHELTSVRTGGLP